MVDGINGKKPLEQVQAQTNDAAQQAKEAAKPQNVQMVQNVEVDKDKGLKVEGQNKPQAQQQAAGVSKKDVAIVGGLAATGVALLFVPVPGARAAGVALLAAGLLTSCSIGTRAEADCENALPGKVDPGALTPEEKKANEEKLADKTFEKVNKEENKTKYENVEYKFVDNKDGTGSVLFENKDGSPSDLKLDFNMNFEHNKITIDPKTGDYIGTVDLSSQKSATITNGQVVKYIDIADEHPKAEGLEMNFKTNSKDQVVVTYGQTGYSHIYNEPATVEANTPIGELQSQLEFLNISGKVDTKILTDAKTGGAAYDGKGGFFYEIVPGDLNEITHGNPEVRLSLATYGIKQAITGKLENTKDGIKITDDAGNQMILKHQQVDMTMGLNDVQTLEGVSVTYNSKEIIRMAPGMDNEGNPVCMAAKALKNGTDTITHYKGVDQNTLNGTKIKEETDEWYKVKVDHFNEACNDAVAKVSGKAKETAEGSVTPGDTILVRSESESDITFGK